MLDDFWGLAAFVVNLDLLEAYGYRLLLGLQSTVEVVVISCSVGFVLAYPIARARMSPQCCDPSGQILRYSML